jgi:hypothetical protein
MSLFEGGYRFLPEDPESTLFRLPRRHFYRFGAGASAERNRT